MKKVMQTVTDPKKGNCWAACIASFLGLSIDLVPNFCDKYPNRWLLETIKWLSAYNYALVYVDLTRIDAKDLEIPIDMPFIVCGKSPRHNCYHACIMEQKIDGTLKLVHDPHPDGTGIVGKPIDYTFIFKKPGSFVE